MTDKTPAEILTEAADLIEGGWCQGNYSNDGHEVNDFSPVEFCSMGAINYAAWSMAEPMYDESEPLDGPKIPNGMSRLKAVLFLAAQVDPTSSVESPLSAVIQWNDFEARTKEDVVYNFRIAAKAAETQ